jgi:uncharacterized membrane protein YjgN (DUF898 family)
MMEQQRDRAMPTGAIPTGSGFGGASGVPGVNPALAAPSSTPFTWTGSPWSLTGVCFLNALLMVLTLGIYGFWGRTEIRRRMWSSVRLYGEPIAYHGTPQELLRGFFTVLVVLLVPLFIIGTVVVVFFGQGSAVFGVYQIGLFLVVYPLLTAIAFYRARRYRLSRTSWRGVRGSMGGSSATYGFFSFATLCAYAPTLGWIGPYRAVALQRRLVSETHLGDRKLRFDGSSGAVYGRYALLWFGTLILYFAVFAAVGFAVGGMANAQNPIFWATLRARDYGRIAAVAFGAIIIWSMISSFYYAKLYNHLAASTLIEPVVGSTVIAGAPLTRFHLNVQGWQLIWLFVTNLLIKYFSLSLLSPVATARSMKYYAEHLSIVGVFDPATIGQNASAGDTSGEGLAQAFDLDAF